MRRGRWIVTGLAVALLIASCGSVDDPAQPAGLPLEIQNQGGSMEGHTPRGFAGSGTGLFAGDNLNSRFPDGEGVQIWLTFDIPSRTPVPSLAVLRSGALTVRGTPFEDLGVLLVEPVSYDTFGPALFDRSSIGDAVTCRRTGDSGLECDVTAAVAEAIGAGAATAQFRMKFETAGDRDSEADLAMFFLSDSNTNEPGIFTLELN